MTQKLSELKEEINNSTVMVGDFNNAFSVIKLIARKSAMI